MARWWRRAPEAPRRGLPPGVAVYAVGDVHGRADLLERMHDRIAADMAAFLGADPANTVEVIHLGDYVDRGPASNRVLDLVDRAWPERVRVTNLRGNHERAMLDFLDDPELAAGRWLGFGGLEALRAYGVALDLSLGEAERLGRAREALNRALPERHRALLAELVAWHRVGDYFFAHAGVDPRKPLDRQDESALLWMREPFLSHPRPLAQMVVHGHTVTKEPVVLPHRIGIDLGAYATGRLAALALRDGEPLRFLIVEAS
ncbi:MAG: serine/threonine protein phosphatase [Alphaproteobacteria bacterium]|nr:serine/threonine protein phosphatase [Alphaproteobacteria bacterium]